MAQSTGTHGLDRRATLDQARRLAESGQIIPAIEAYELLALDDPSDWTLRNTLGDLLVRARHTDKAVQQFLKAAQLQADAGFMAHASGLLKKALRVAPGHSEAKKRLDALNGARFKRPEQGSTPRIRTSSASAAVAAAAARVAQPTPVPVPPVSPMPAVPKAVAPVAVNPVVPTPSRVPSVPAVPVPVAPVAVPAPASMPSAVPVVTPEPVAAKVAPAAPKAVAAVAAKSAGPKPLPDAAVAVEAAKPVTVEPLAAPSPSTTVLAASAFSSMAVLDVRPALVAASKFVVEPTSRTEAIDPSAHADLDLSAWLDGGVWGGKPGDAPA